MPDQIYPIVNPNIDDPKEQTRQLAIALGFVLQGKIDCSEEITLSASSTTTVVNDVRVGPQSNVQLGAMSATAQAVSPYVKPGDIGEKTFTITHTSAADTDMAVRYSVIG